MRTATAGPASGTILNRNYGWFWLVQVAAIVETALLLASAIYLRDIEALLFAIIVLLTLVWILLRPARVLPVLIRCLVFADVAVWMVPAAITNTLNHESLESIVLPVALGSTAVAGLVATACFLLARANPAAGRRASRTVGIIALVVVLGVAALAGATASGNIHVGVGDLVISATNARFSTATLRADHGVVTVDFTNNDLFWHTFTVGALGVDVRAPVKGHRRISFRAAPGTYEFICAVPGHKQIGMRGTLVIR